MLGVNYLPKMHNVDVKGQKKKSIFNVPTFSLFCQPTGCKNIEQAELCRHQMLDHKQNSFSHQRPS